MRGPIARNTLKTSLVLGMRLVAQAGTLLLIARLLGPSEFGAYAGVVALAVMLGTLSTFGMHFVLLAEVSRAPERPAAILPVAFTTTMVCGSVLLAAYLSIAHFAFAEAGIAGDVLLVLGITELLLQPLLHLPASRYQGQGRVAAAQLLITLPLLLRLGVAVAIWFSSSQDPLRDYAHGGLLASLIALCIAGIGTRRDWPNLRNWRLPRAGELRNAAGYAALTATAMGPAELDKMLAMKLLPLASAGVYATGARIVGALTLPMVAMMLSAMPRLFRDGTADPIALRQLLRQIFIAAFGYSVALSGALWLVAPLLPRLFGDEYHALSEAVRWLTVAVPALVLRMAAGTVLMAIGRPWMRVGFELLGLTMLTMSAVLLAPSLDIPGMALALACSEWAMALLGLFAVRSSAHSARPQAFTPPVA